MPSESESETEVESETELSDSETEVESETEIGDPDASVHPSVSHTDLSASDPGTLGSDPSALDLYYSQMRTEVECLREGERFHETQILEQRQHYENTLSSLSLSVQEAQSSVDRLVKQAEKAEKVS
ncbi:hypothetical protein KIPB_010474 [Kipferlia bialata]|uniref:Uncharacterized protein n=1 Tax=Kipferlia bialata TaxID=797122 RepID=A0A9K3D593_9EUKA|nr:hypothetical protein KIPB_010474 [Kipferlia bialata]|eukprot:g10474.t1